MSGTSNVFKISRAAKKSLDKPNIHSRIRGAIKEIFDRIETFSPYPESECKLDKNTLKMLESSAETPEEKKLLEKARGVVRKANLSRMMKLLPDYSDDDGSSDEEEESDDEEDPEDQEEDPEDEDSAPESRDDVQKDDSLVDNWSFVQSFEVEPQIPVVAENDQKWEKVVEDLKMELLYFKDHAVGLTQELKESKAREEKMMEEMKGMGRIVLDNCYSQETELDELQDKLGKQALVVADLMAKAGFATDALERSRKKESELQETVKTLEDQLEEAKKSLQDYKMYYVDNWTVAKIEDKLHAVVANRERKLLDVEDHVVRLTDELRESQAREKKLKEEMKGMGSFVLDKCTSQDTQLDELQKKLEMQSLLFKELMEEAQSTTEALEKSRKREAELRETLKTLEEKSQRALWAQNENFMKIVYHLSKECRNCHMSNIYRRQRVLDQEKIRVAEQEKKEIDMEFVDAQWRRLIEILDLRGPQFD